MDNFCFYFQNRLIKTSQTEGQQYSDAYPVSIPWLSVRIQLQQEEANTKKLQRLEYNVVFLFCLIRQPSFPDMIRPLDAPICLSMEEVAVRPGHKVLVDVNNECALIVGNP